jgi:hypothetical protein
VQAAEVERAAGAVGDLGGGGDQAGEAVVVLGGAVVAERGPVPPDQGDPPHTGHGVAHRGGGVQGALADDHGRVLRS